jgi:signal transduction histidine kinase
MPAEVDEAMLAPSDLATLRRGAPLVRLHPRFLLDSLFLRDAARGEAPLLEQVILLPGEPTLQEPAVVVQYWVQGFDMVREFARIDRRIAAQAGSAFLAGGLLIAGSLAWGFRRLQGANNLLLVRASELAGANRELAQVARTAAIGAITAHLVHGLRNPLAGLEGYVAAQGDGDTNGDDLASAVESTRRLRAIMDEVLGVLRDVQDGVEYESSVREVLDGVRQRLEPLAARLGVRLECGAGGVEASLDARPAGLGALVLANLVQNAIEASARGAVVRITVDVFASTIHFAVADEAGGLPGDVRRDPFRPRRSSKPDGAGVGLAISHELARHAGGELGILRSDERGTVFQMRLPVLARKKEEEEEEEVT